MNWQQYWKAIAGFLAAVLSNAATDLVIHHQPFPSTWQDGLRWIGTIALTTFMVYQFPANQVKAPSAPDTGKHEKP